MPTLTKPRDDAGAERASPNTAAAPALYPDPFEFTDREGKARYIAAKYAPILKGNVLDVGCDRRQLKAALPATVRYTGVDIGGEPDVTLNLEKQDLPFADKAFDCVVACDVLEHLDRLHAVFDELLRVSASRVIVSLPNPARDFLDAVIAGKDGLKYYGLPVDAPADRHKWFFTADEARRFLSLRGGRSGFDVEQFDAREYPLPMWSDRSGKDRLAAQGLRSGTLWCVLLRRNP